MSGVRFGAGTGIFSSSSRSDRRWRAPSLLSSCTGQYYPGNKALGVWSWLAAQLLMPRWSVWFSLQSHCTLLLKFAYICQRLRIFRFQTKFASFLCLVLCFSKILFLLL